MTASRCSVASRWAVARDSAPSASSSCWGVDAPAALQRARALRGVARGGLGGLRGAQVGLGGADLLAARACLHQVQLRLRRRDLRRLAVALRALERVVEPREDLAGAHDLPAPHLERRQPPRQLEAEHALVDLDHALQLVARRRRLRAAGQQAERERERSAPPTIIYHTYDNMSRRSPVQGGSACGPPSACDATG